MRKQFHVSLIAPSFPSPLYVNCFGRAILKKTIRKCMQVETGNKIVVHLPSILSIFLASLRLSPFKYNPEVPSIGVVLIGNKFSLKNGAFFDFSTNYRNSRHLNDWAFLASLS